ncbi:unnamed protein product [Closterium sp. Yama58-4]|nr:unnamed protein product [Closterium sp. Yama58-4]
MLLVTKSLKNQTNSSQLPFLSAPRHFLTVPQAHQDRESQLWGSNKGEVSRKDIMAPRSPLSMRALLGLLSITVAILAALVPTVLSRGLASPVYDSASRGGIPTHIHLSRLRRGLSPDVPRVPLHVVFHGTWGAADVALVEDFVRDLPAQGYESLAQLGSVAVDNNYYGVNSAEAVQHQIDIGALPFNRAALYLLVTSGDIAVTIGGETFCEDYCSKQTTLNLRGPDGSVAETKFIHAGDVFARCPDRCTFRAAHSDEPNPLRHLLRHLGSAITESVPGPDAGPIIASEFPDREPLSPATVAEPSASGSAPEQEEGNATATTAKMCAAYPSETFIHAITYGSNSSGVSSGGLAGDIHTCAAASVGPKVVPPTVAGRAK